MNVLSRPVLWCLGFLAVASGCGPEDPRTEEMILEDSSGLGSINRHNLMTDADLTGYQNVTAAQVQAFLSMKKSYLAQYRDPQSGNKTAAEIIVERCRAHRISPIYMLARIDTESALVRSGTSSKLAQAAGYACPDSTGCDPAFFGFSTQIDGAAKSFRNYLTLLESGKTTISGWAKGRTKTTLDPCTVTPANNATAALYTYTPWVGAYAAECGTSQWGGSSLVALLFARFKGEFNWGDPGSADSVADAPPPPPNRYQSLTGDFNGDGKTDVVTVSPNGGGGWADWVSVDLSSGSNFISQPWWTVTARHMRNGGEDSAYHILTGDFNGDGKTDIATVSPNAGGGWAQWIAMEISTGASFRSEVWYATTPAHMRNGGSSSRYEVVTGDFNGDGKTDIATVSPNAGGGWADWMSVEISTGTGFKSQNWWGSTPGHMRNGGGGRQYRVLTGDFNGDGKTDLATLSLDGAGAWNHWFAMEISTGAGFVSGVWSAATPQHIRNGGASNRFEVLAADLNGDGRTDIATVSPNAGGGWARWVAVEISTGSDFASAGWNALTPAHMRNGGSGQRYSVVAGDFNGDGKADLATVSPDGGGGWAEWAALELSTGEGFTSTSWYTPTPQHMRNGGSSSDYQVLSGNFGGSRRTDLATLSRDAGGAWNGWFTVDLSWGSGFNSGGWNAVTPQHIRNGG